MSAGITSKDSMFSVRETPWHGLGVVLKTPPKTVKEALKLASLDWTVEKVPLYVKVGKTFEQVDGQFGVRRSSDGDILSTVSHRYEPLSNERAFNFLDGVLGEMIFETAGSLHGGRRVWGMVRLPEFIEIGGDKVGQYACVDTTHDALGAVRLMVTPIRVVCQNTLHAAVGAARATYSVRHLGDLSLKTHEARTALGVTVNYYKQFAKVGNRLASQKLTDRKLMDVLSELYPTTDLMGDRAIRNRQDARAAVVAIFRGEGSNPETVGNAPGSKWCAINAIAEYQDHFVPVQTDRFRRILDDPENVKGRGFQLVAAA